MFDEWMLDTIMIKKNTEICLFMLQTLHNREVKYNIVFCFLIILYMIQSFFENYEKTVIQLEI
jgi:hypothetical protein